MAAIKQLLAKVLNFIPGPIISFVRGHKELVFLVMVGVLAFLAFEGYRIVRGCIYAGAGVGFTVVTYYVLGRFVPSMNAPMGANPQFFLKPIIAILVGVAAVLFVKFAYKIVVFFIGAAVGFVGGYFIVAKLVAKFFNTLAFLNTKLAAFMIGGAIAIVCALFFVVAFQHICMVGSGVGCMALAAFFAGKVIIPSSDLKIALFFLLVGAIGGIFCTVHQYKIEERANEIIF